ncbi:hypothetical protein P4493_04880 [Bacillus thuringiensis]|nr:MULTISPECIES: hypothetical protein [Bacillus]EEM74151.1 hypothetical protein bthur0010_58110 [Bacillus thuringiensis serovar pondicheriensis BGSC 4BA1]EEM99845.1 hypothetical protein bthur0014_53410 [Bacillus thuringiensis IBL 4222]MCR6819862.1 hypothetical protein [Bacillus thuringiensis]MED2951419.1 hypothetical protein [Bacillus thuringiensis]MED3028477.1 hypothetical protein [Bacillus thuringiensis]
MSRCYYDYGKTAKNEGNKVEKILGYSISTISAIVFFFLLYDGGQINEEKDLLINYLVIVFALITMIVGIDFREKVKLEGLMQYKLKLHINRFMIVVCFGFLVARIIL